MARKVEFHIRMQVLLSLVVIWIAAVTGVVAIGHDPTGEFETGVRSVLQILVYGLPVVALAILISYVPVLWRSGTRRVRRRWYGLVERWSLGRWSAWVWPGSHQGKNGARLTFWQEGWHWKDVPPPRCLVTIDGVTYEASFVENEAGGWHTTYPHAFLDPDDAPNGRLRVDWFRDGERVARLRCSVEDPDWSPTASWWPRFVSDHQSRASRWLREDRSGHDHLIA